MRDRKRRDFRNKMFIQHCVCIVFVIASNWTLYIPALLFRMSKLTSWTEIEGVLFLLCASGAFIDYARRVAEGRSGCVRLWGGGGGPRCRCKGVITHWPLFKNCLASYPTENANSVFVIIKTWGLTPANESEFDKKLWVSNKLCSQNWIRTGPMKINNIFIRPLITCF